MFFLWGEGCDFLKKTRFREKKREKESFDSISPSGATKDARGGSGEAKIAFDNSAERCYNITTREKLLQNSQSETSMLQMALHKFTFSEEKINGIKFNY